ncbi:hypothetical protein ACQKLN_22215 [Paenibacillus glucanolyticus]|uniref:Uncharacterized protein n=3 Tax=Paenibacillaceae TaxID=186822 RepID=A0A7Z2ZQW5_9BACL|nr:MULTISPECIES: hypothetical protein [Paenibacillaceae]MCK8487528.1 hypothetical protein [Paenibacillus mellifer]MCT1400972.1 hypothetical protein [Paenibacillus sp. p3-SID867]QJD88505.1 hypothetical protein HH215_35210 [Cohnella herbarum]
MVWRHGFIELKDMNNYPINQLKELDKIELLIPESMTKFNQWCKDIQAVKHNKYLHPLIIEYQEEIAYRKARDEEHQFYKEIDPYSLRNSKVENRRNKAVLFIDVSDKQANRTYGIMNSLIDAISELGGRVDVFAGEQDNIRIRLLDHEYSASLIEIMVKRRSFLSNLQSGSMTGLSPMYEKIPSGLLRMEFTEIFGYAHRNKTAQSLCFNETLDRPFEKQIGEILIDCLKNAIGISVSRHIAEREYEVKKKEKERLEAIEESKKQELQRLEEYILRKQKLKQNIENQMKNWVKANKLRDYAEELERFVVTCEDEITKKSFSTYIQLVREAAEDCDPGGDILNKVQELEHGSK